MTQSDDFFRALCGKRPEGQVPVWELEFHGWDAAGAGHVVLGEEFAGLPRAAQRAAMQRNAEIMIDVCRQLNHAALTVPTGYWNAAPGQLAYYIMPDETRFEQTAIIRRMAGDSLVLVGSAGGIMGANYNEDFCVRMFEDPQSIDEQAEAQLAAGLANARRYRDCGAGAVFAAADMADNSGPFFNPAQMERWVYPFLQRWAEAVHQMGLRCILHSDGRLTPYLDRIASTGIDALQAIDPVAGMNMRQAKDIVGERIGLCGNIDCGRLLMGSADEISNLTRDLLQMATSEGGIVLGASNAVQVDVPMENYRAMIAAQRQYGSCRCRHQ